MDRAKVRHAAGDAARTLHRRLGDVVIPGYETVPVAATFPVEPSVSDLGVPVEDLVRMMRSVRLDNAGPGELEGYVDDSLGRFLHTTALALGLEGDCLELGANPYFQTLCLQQCTGLRLTLANYFGEDYGDTLTQDLHYWDPATRSDVTTPMTSSLFNTEEAPFPWPDASFDVVLFCEIIEHLLRDPVAVMREIRRVLRPGGTLIMTTPNVARLENVMRLVEGANIYDAYSAYPYGRHVREYTRHELVALLHFMGFEVESHYTADAHTEPGNGGYGYREIVPLLQRRAPDLGQYLFTRSTMTEHAPVPDTLPSNLFRNYPAERIVDSGR
ncbi:MAG: methyltransferase domain-containing protein [Acidimicrobiia bacterium]